MTIQTRNKRKNWQAELGINVHKVFCQRQLSSLYVPVKWALRDQVMGIDRPSYGHSLPVLRASSAQSVGRFLGTFCGSAALTLCMMLYSNFVILRWRFSWYFHHIYDTSMILFCKIIRKVSFLYIIMYQAITPVFNQKDDTLRLFSRKNFFFMCV